MVLIVIVTLLWLVVLYLLGFNRFSGGVVNWSSFKINTKVFLFLLIIYIIIVSFLYKKLS